MTSQLVWQCLVEGQCSMHNGSWKDQPWELNEILNTAAANHDRFVVWPEQQPGRPAPRETWTFDLVNCTQKANAPRATVRPIRAIIVVKLNIANTVRGLADPRGIISTVIQHPEAAEPEFEHVGPAM